jgi:hypothetical protein
MREMVSSKRHGLLLAACAACISLIAGCARVAPYQRGKLAHPTMTMADHGPAEAHLLAVHEGATGGGALAESGCGCN